MPSSCVAWLCAVRVVLRDVCCVQVVPWKPGYAGTFRTQPRGWTLGVERDCLSRHDRMQGPTCHIV